MRCRYIFVQESRIRLIIYLFDPLGFALLTTPILASNLIFAFAALSAILVAFSCFFP